LIAVCSDIKAWGKQLARYWTKTPEDAREGIVETLTEYNGGNEPVQRDKVFRSCAIASQTLMPVAKEMGYDSCSIGLTNFDAIALLIHLPEDHLIPMLVAVGKWLAELWASKGSCRRRWW